MRFSKVLNYEKCRGVIADSDEVGHAFQFEAGQ